MSLPSFEVANERLKNLIEAQDDPTGCQAVYFPNGDGFGAFYTIQIAVRSPQCRTHEAKKFIEAAFEILRDGGRELCIRHEEVSLDKEFDTLDIVSRGYLRLLANEKVGEILYLQAEPEMVMWSDVNDFTDWSPSSAAWPIDLDAS